MDEPLPMALSTPTHARPTDDAVHGRQTEPGTLPSSFVVKNGSNSRALISGIPVPVSRTVRVTYGPGT